jgi:four helix bundle protein
LPTQFALPQEPQRFPVPQLGTAIEEQEGMPPCVVCDRAFVFAIEILKLCDALWTRGPSARHVASQLMRCGCSIGANVEEAQEAQTKADFVAKMSVSRKEARETVWWLRTAHAMSMLPTSEDKAKLDEARQLLAMTRAAVRTARLSNSRGSSTV